VSAGDTGEETSRIGAGADNGTYGGREIGSDAVTRPCGEKYGTDSKTMTYADKILHV